MGRREVARNKKNCRDGNGLRKVFKTMTYNWNMQRKMLVSFFFFLSYDASGCITKKSTSVERLGKYWSYYSNDNLQLTC